METPLLMPANPGVTLRGAFGLAFKHIACACPRDNPVHRPTCAFGYLFESPVSPGTLTGTDSDTAPHPFLFSVGALPANTLMEEGQGFQFDLTLFGRGCRYLPFCVLAVQRLGAVGFGKTKGRFTVSGVRQRDGRRWVQILDPATGLLAVRKPQVGPPAWKRLGGETWSIRTLTPLHLRKHGKPLHHPGFADLVNAICRRVNQLAAAHQEKQVQVDPRPLLEKAAGIRTREVLRQWVAAQRYSKRQGRPMPLEGLMAVFEVHGELAPFEDLFLLGELAHVGKYTAFGFGQFVAEQGETG